MNRLLILLAIVGCKGKDDDPTEADADTDADTDSDTDVDTDTDADTDADSDADADADVIVDCQNSLPAPPSGELCSVTGDAATATHILLQGTILGDRTTWDSGDLLLQRGPNGLIECVGCDCAASAPAETLVVSCPNGVVSPGLINAHDHIRYALEDPSNYSTERYDHRDDWRNGDRGHTELFYSVSNTDNAVLYGEVRMLLGGATSIAGSISSTEPTGLMRNLDNADFNEGLGGWEVDYATFPLGLGVPLASSGCDGYSPDPSFVLDNRIYLPHISEGIDLESNNEFQCLSGNGPDSVDLIADNTSIVHGIGLRAEDIGVVSDRGAHLVWSPRSNISLYGETAPLITYRNMGVPIALGTDWTVSGSATMLRELQCADYLNQTHYGATFSDRDLWLMVTRDAAVAMGAEAQIGTLRPGQIADITVFDGTTRDHHRAVIDAGISDVELVLRGSKPLTGDSDLLASLLEAADFGACEVLEDCVSDHSICVDTDGVTLASIRSAVGSNSYDLFICAAPTDEPSCIPLREDESGDGMIYPISVPDDADGDGVLDAEDNCPNIFNPGTPVHGLVQADTDGDGDGDACDPCPLSSGNSCVWRDFDEDGIPNGDDNCPDDANPTQDDADGDFVGDSCDACPAYPSPSGACPESVYDVKNGGITPNTTVVLAGLQVTAVNDRGAFLQLPTTDPTYVGADYSGIFVYMPTIEPKPLVGDQITIEGVVADFFGQLELADVVGWTVQTAGNPAMVPELVTADEVATGGSRQWELESVLITLDAVTVTAIDLPPGMGDSAPTNEFEVDGSLIVNDYFFAITPAPLVNETFSALTGVLRWAHQASKLEVRDLADVASGPVALDDFTPDATVIEEGATTDALLAISLTRPAGVVETVTLDCQPAAVLTCPATLEFQPGEQVLGVPLTGVAAAIDAATVTASLNGGDRVASVRVYNDASPRAVLGIDPDPLNMGLDTTAELTITLDLPAASTDTTVTLSTTGIVTVPASLVILAGQSSEMVTVTSGPTEGSATLTATADTALTSTINASPGLVGSGLLITQYLEGSSGTNKYIEITNLDAADIELSDCMVTLYTNGNSTPGNSNSLNAGTLANGEVYLLCNGGFTTGAPCDQDWGGLNFNGNDAVELACNGVPHDIIGQIGFDPPNDQWGTSPLSTKDSSIIRDCSVFTGDTDGSDAFDPSTGDWLDAGQDDGSDLGLRVCP